MRKLVYLGACSVDMFIARPDGSYDLLLQEGEHMTDLLDSFPETMPGHLRDVLGIRGENKRFDAILMGRGTYEEASKVGLTNPYPHMHQYVFSQSMRERPDPRVELVSEDAVARVNCLKQESGKDIWLCGGSTLAATLFDQIDELILKVSPILLGSGKSLVAGGIKPTGLVPIESKSYRNGVILLHYRLQH